MNLDRKLKKPKFEVLKSYILEEIIGFFDSNLRKNFLKQLKINKFHKFMKEYIDRMISNEKVTLKIIALKAIIERSNINCFSKFLEIVQKPLQLEIDLKLCFLTNPLPLLKIIGRKTTLIHLSLNLFLTNLSNKAFKILSVSLTNLVNLSLLNLNICNNNLEDDSICILFETVGFLVNLEVLKLDLSFNRIINLGLYINKLKNLIKLAELQIVFQNNPLMCNGLGLEGAKELSNVVSELKNLGKVALDLSSNLISIDGFIALLSSLVELPYLYYVKLILNDNSISCSDTNGSMIELTNQIEKLNKVKYFHIYLKKNNIDNIGIVKLLLSLKSMNSLTELYLDISKNPFQIDLKDINSSLKKGIKSVEICLK